MTGRHPQPHTLAGAYAMDALDAGSKRSFDRHVARCQECADEISGLREVVGRLAAASAERPPEGLRAQILASAERTRQLPPLLGRQSGGRGRRASRRRTRRSPRLAVALGAAIAVALAAIWLTGLPGWRAPGRHTLASQAITAVLTAPDAVMIDAPLTSKGTAAVVMSLREGKLVFAAAGLRPLPASRCYELWLMDHGRDRPAGLLPMPRHGMTGPVIAAGLHRGDRLGLSVEPATGSRRPTSPLILALAL
jgi:anti-sigma-K factor RskA